MTVFLATPTFTSVKEFKDWCSGRLFRRHMLYFPEGYLWKQQQDETKNRSRGDDFSTVMNMIIADQTAKARNLIEEEVDKSELTYSDWLASALKRIFDADSGDRDGLFEGHIVSSNRRYIILYCIMKFFIRDCTKSIATKPIDTKQLKLYRHTRNSLASHHAAVFQQGIATVDQLINNDNATINQIYQDVKARSDLHALVYAELDDYDARGKKPSRGRLAPDVKWDAKKLAWRLPKILRSQNG